MEAVAASIPLIKPFSKVKFSGHLQKVFWAADGSNNTRISWCTLILWVKMFNNLFHYFNLLIYPSLCLSVHSFVKIIAPLKDAITIQKLLLGFRLTNKKHIKMCFGLKIRRSGHYSRVPFDGVSTVNVNLCIVKICIKDHLYQLLLTFCRTDIISNRVASCKRQIVFAPIPDKADIDWLLILNKIYTPLSLDLRIWLLE